MKIASTQGRHSHSEGVACHNVIPSERSESRNPRSWTPTLRGSYPQYRPWIPAYAGMTVRVSAVISSPYVASTRPRIIAMSGNKFPPDWDEEMVERVLANYEEQSEEEAISEDEAAFDDQTQTMIAIPHSLVPAVLELIARHQAQVSDR